MPLKLWSWTLSVCGCEIAQQFNCTVCATFTICIRIAVDVSVLSACILQVDEPSYERVIVCCKEAIERVPGNVKAHYRCGIAFFHLGRYDDAVASLQKAAELQGKSGMYMASRLSHCNRCPVKRAFDDTHTHPFNGSLSRTTRVSRYQKGETNLDFAEARDSFLQAGCPPCRPTNSVKALKA